MKLAVIGGNGRAGSLIAREAVARGHEVTAIVRKGTSSDAGVRAMQKDLMDLTYDDLKDFDVVVDAFGTWSPEAQHLHQDTLRHLTDILSGKENRLLVVGGAGSLYVDPGHTTMLMDSPEFPAAYMPTATSMGKALAELRERNDVRWTYVSPAADFRADGERTGKYALGGEELSTNSNGESMISYSDYAIALVDEAERGDHVGERISVVGV